MLHSAGFNFSFKAKALGRINHKKEKKVVSEWFCINCYTMHQCCMLFKRKKTHIFNVLICPGVRETRTNSHITSKIIIIIIIIHKNNLTDRQHLLALEGLHERNKVEDIWELLVGWMNSSFKNKSGDTPCILGPFDIGGPGSQACIVSALSEVTLSIGSRRSLWAHETRYPSFTLRARWSWYPIFGIARLPWEA